MSNFIQQIEAALLPTAIKYVPEGSEPKAVIHQWAHAIAGNSDLVGGVDATRVVDYLKAAGIYKRKEQFRKKLYGEINFPPPNSPNFRFVDLFAGNRKRDRHVNRELRSLGWRVVRIWQHQLGKPARVAGLVNRALESSLCS